MREVTMAKKRNATGSTVLGAAVAATFAEAWQSALEGDVQSDALRTGYKGKGLGD
jgi:hypothetical protein